MTRMVLLGVALLLACGGNGTEEAAEEDGTAQLSSATSSPSTEDNAPPSEPLTLNLDQCQHAPQAAIYNRPAKLWRAEQPGENYVSLTVWQLNAGGTEFSLSRSAGSNTYRIDTVNGGQKVGSGSVAITSQGEGASFEISGKDQNGNDLRATITCTKLVPLVAEGG
jgi:hypothetical protein